MPSFWERSMKITADPKREPYKWNNQWEQAISRNLTPEYFREVFDTCDISHEEMLSNHRKRLHDLCRMQRTFTVNAATYLALEDFERRWIEAGAFVRQKHLLEGLVRTRFMAIGMEESRLCCEELTLSNLQLDQGQAFVRMVKLFIVENPMVMPTTPIMTSSARWDYLIGRDREDLSETDKNFQAYFDATRNVFICFFLENVLASFHGKESAPVVISKSTGRDRVGAQTIRDTKKAMGSETTNALHREVMAGRREIQVIVCENCHMNEHTLEDGHRFMMCRPCKNNLDRRIFYCSKQCQVEDWKPRHKIICGKEMTLEAAEASAIGDLKAPAPSYPEDDSGLNDLEKMLRNPDMTEQRDQLVTALFRAIKSM